MTNERDYCGLSASSKVRVSAITSSAFAEVSGQRRTPCAVNCAPRLALRLTSFIIAAGSTAVRASDELSCCEVSAAAAAKRMCSISTKVLATGL